MTLDARGMARAAKYRIMRMLNRPRFRSSIRRSDVFLVTYPRSGTTWLGFLIANVIKVDLSEQLNIRTLVKYVPGANTEYFQSGSLRTYDLHDDPRIFLLHAPYDPALSRVVYVLRDPRDVMVSYWHFLRLTEENFTLTLREFVEGDNQWPCRWDEHVAGWLLEHKHPDLLVLRYEELHRDTIGSLTRVLDFSGISYSKDKVESAVKEAQFENMQALEAKSGFALDGAAARRGERFVRRGEIGNWKNEFDESCVRILEEKYSSVMGQVGYGRIT